MTQTNDTNTLQTFFYQEKNIRTVIKDGETLWMLQDVRFYWEMLWGSGLWRCKMTTLLRASHLHEAINGCRLSLLNSKSRPYTHIFAGQKPDVASYAEPYLRSKRGFFSRCLGQLFSKY